MVARERDGEHRPREEDGIFLVSKAQIGDDFELETMFDTARRS